MNPIVDAVQWQEAYAAQLAEEKAVTRALDALAAKRRRMPWMKVDGDYRFDGPDGSLSLPDLFDGRCQLIVYHHMLLDDRPPCPGCSMFGDQVPHIAHVNARDTSFVMVARAPVASIESYRARMGWTFPFYSSMDGFGEDFGVPRDGHGLNVFISRDGAIYRTWFTTARGTETLGSVWGLIDLTPKGRQEAWQDAPDWVEQGQPYQWWKLHDEYPKAKGGCPACG